MSLSIVHVAPGSIGAKLDLRCGDEILSIAGEEVIDQIDYQALTARSLFEMTYRRGDAEDTVLVRKTDDEPLGLTLDQTAVIKPRECRNHCIFCFIDQMPPNMRETLYVKDDDWRLSLMMGNFITMTNINDAEFDRILRRHVSPLFISVQCTDPEMRVRMMRNPAAARIMERLRTLKAHGIRFNCQVVLCPGWNDGDILRRTLEDLWSLRPEANSVALVPVGLTKWRDGLPQITPYDRASAKKLVESVLPLQEKFMEASGTRFVFPADEFYCLSGLPLPRDEDYEGYPQIENGVGMLRLFEEQLALAAEEFPCDTPAPKKMVIACGTSVAPFFRELLDRYAPDHGHNITVQPIRNRFFGESITVTGLLTGGDMIEQLKDIRCDEFLICRNTIRNEGDFFLDDVSVDRFKASLPAPVRIVPNTGIGLWRAICGMEEN